MNRLLLNVVFLLAGSCAVQASPLVIGFFEYHSFSANSSYNQFHLGLRTYDPPQFADDAYNVESPLSITSASLHLQTSSGSYTVGFACTVLDPCFSNTPMSYLSGWVSDALQIIRATLSYTVSGPAVWQLRGGGQFIPETLEHEAVMESLTIGSFLTPNNGTSVPLRIPGPADDHVVPEPGSLAITGITLCVLVAKLRRRSV